MGNLCCGAKSTTTKGQKHGGGKQQAVHQEVIGFVDSLPPSHEEVTVDHVYDGDTMTVLRRSGQKCRVRFLGIDAPELKEKEAFAQESANYVKAMCRKNAKVWLSFEPGNEKDKYDRLLAYIYVSNPNGGAGFYCLNACVLQEGLAFFYSPKNEELSLRLMLLSAQRKAIERKKNVWGTIDLDKKVFITRSGRAFHDASCENVKTANLTPIAVAAAFDRGLSPCRSCHPA